jgi:hypothetical protein
MEVVVPALPPLPAFPASGTDVERGQWLTLAGLHAQVAKLESDRLTREAILGLMAEFSKVYPKMGAMDFDQAVELIKLVKGA